MREESAAKASDNCSRNCVTDCRIGNKLQSRAPVSPCSSTFNGRYLREGIQNVSSTSFYYEFGNKLLHGVARRTANVLTEN